MKKIWLYLSALLCMLFAFTGCDAQTAEVLNTVIEQQIEAEILEEDLQDAEDVTETDSEEQAVIDKDGSYTSRDEVALYLYTYGELPQNFITKKEAQQLGWDSKKGNLDEVAPGMSIGGDRFGNYEQILPDNDYKECDINYSGGYRGDERIVFSDDGDIYYTDDHYASFTQLY